MELEVLLDRLDGLLLTDVPVEEVQAFNKGFSKPAGELIGALAYRFGFMPTEPVAGVTPIEDILDSARISPAGAAEGDAVAAPIGTPIGA